MLLRGHPCELPCFSLCSWDNPPVVPRPDKAPSLAPRAPSLTAPQLQRGWALTWGTGDPSGWGHQQSCATGFLRGVSSEGGCGMLLHVWRSSVLHLPLYRPETGCSQLNSSTLDTCSEITSWSHAPGTHHNPSKSFFAEAPIALSFQD